MKITSLYHFARGYFHFFMSWRHVPVNRRDLVLDVGSGDNPNIRADILCDLFPQRNEERSGKLGIWMDERPFVICDIQRLPFRDKVFDYVLCFHLLEHVADPEKAAKELMRVGKRGRIETPSKLFELLYHWPFHQWMVSRRNGGGLLFEKKDPLTQGLFPEAVKKSGTFGKLVSEFSSDFLVELEWKGSFSVEVVGKGLSPSGTPRAADARDFVERIKHKKFRRKLKTFLISLIRRFITAHRHVSISEILCCPYCFGDLSGGKEGLDCKSCAQHFPVRDRIYFFTGEKILVGQNG